MHEHQKIEPLLAGPRPVGRPRPRKQVSDHGLLIAATIALVAVVLMSWWNWPSPIHPRQPWQAHPSVAAEVPAAAPQSAKDAASAIVHPLEVPAAETVSSLPALSDSDGLMATALAALVAQPDLRSMLQMDGFVRRVVATVDSLAREHSATRLWPVAAAPERFVVRVQDDHATIDPDNGLRYTAFVLLCESVDVQRLAATYRSTYPLFQQAYEELGYPKGYFNDRLVEVIDHLLAAPRPALPVAVRLVQVQGPEPLSRPWLHYEFVDPALESLSAGQKIMVRMGDVNEQRLKARLAAFRAVIAGPAFGK